LTALAVGFIGGGPLGPALSRGLIDGGFDLIAFDADRSAELTSEMSGAYWCPCARDVAEAADVVVTSTSASDFREVFQAADGILRAKRLPPVIETTAMPLSTKQGVRKDFAERRSQFLDAAVDGTPSTVAARTAMIYVSGDRDTYLEYQTVLKAMCPHLNYVGTALNGSKVRLVGQLLATIHTTAAVEAMLYAKRSGLGVEDVIALISNRHSAVRGLFGDRAARAGSAEPQSATVDATLRDADEIISYATEIGAPIDLTSAAAEYYQRLSAAGWGDADPTALFTELIGTEE
jgi:3-hydroxyisobutyrate dehydrogenase-like beta-hydroxyacid dehydrogenase